MLVLADKSTELIRLGTLRNGNATGVEVSLETALGPGANSLVKCLLSGARGTIGSLSSSLVDVGSRSTKGVGGLASNVAVEEVGTVLADESAELVGLGALGNWRVLDYARMIMSVTRSHTRNAVLVSELLELRLAPSVNDHIGQSGVCLLSRGRSAGGLLLSLEVSKARVAADGGNELVALQFDVRLVLNNGFVYATYVGDLGSGETVGVEPLLEIRLYVLLVTTTMVARAC